MPPSKSSKQCIMCSASINNPVEFGEKLHYKNISAHYFCLLLSSGLVQNGTDEEGLFGFMPSDIRAEVKRAEKMSCFYCKERGANIGCCDKYCRRSFHFSCAKRNDCLFEFANTFRSFCHQHHKIKKPKEVHSKTDTCNICLDDMGPYKPTESIQSPCCSKTNWYHRKCLMQMAHSSGYFFKCPLCNNNDFFREELKMRGIFIPDKDASWEMDPNAFAELTERPNQCEAEVCKCKLGRNHVAKNENSLFSFVYCTFCGGHCVHKHCYDTDEYICDECVNFTGVKVGNNELPGEQDIVELSSNSSIHIERDISNENSYDSDLSDDISVCGINGSLSDCFQSEHNITYELISTTTTPTPTIPSDTDSEEDEIKPRPINGCNSIESADDTSNDETLSANSFHSKLSAVFDEFGCTNKGTSDSMGSLHYESSSEEYDDVIKPVQLSPNKKRRIEDSSDEDSYVKNDVEFMPKQGKRQKRLSKSPVKHILRKENRNKRKTLA